MAEEFLEDKAVITGQERALSPTLLLGVDCLRYPEKRNVLRLAREDVRWWKALFLWNYTLGSPSPLCFSAVIEDV